MQSIQQPQGNHKESLNKPNYYHH